MSACFGKDRRLLTAADYRTVFEATTLRSGQAEFLLLARAGAAAHSRLGLAVAKKHVRRAVARNRLKRIAREVFRQLPTGALPLDVVLLTRPGAATVDRARWREGLHAHLIRLQRRAGTADTPARDTR